MKLFCKLDSTNISSLKRGGKENNKAYLLGYLAQLALDLV
jgi:hypothetical protein